jgi:hypothetical protein
VGGDTGGGGVFGADDVAQFGLVGRDAHAEVSLDGEGRSVAAWG